MPPRSRRRAMKSRPSTARFSGCNAMLSRRSLLKSTVLAATAAFATRVVAAAPAAEAVTPALIEAATKEGKLAFYTAMDLPVGEKFARAFEALYPGIAVRVERSGAERVFQRIGQEMDSNIHAVDIVNTADGAHIIVWKRSGWLAPYVPEDVAQHFPKEYQDADGMSAYTRVWLSSLGYNTNLVKPEDAPRSFADLLDPKWAGKMVNGQPVEVVYPSEGTPFISGPTAIFRSAPNPNAARLFQSYLHSREGQQLLVDFARQHSIHAQVTEKPGVRTLKDIKLLKEDPVGVEAQADEIKTRYAKLF